jgi:hypothetical protein
MEWPRFLPDLTLWHPWHAERGTLPVEWRGADIAGVCRSLGVPAWAPRKPWRVELPGIEVHDERAEGERVLEWRTPRGVLRSRWTRGPDGDWWQAEYPVKSREDLPAAQLVAETRRYILEPPAGTATAGAVDIMELPQRPWSELFHAFLGWSDGLMLFLEEPDAVAAIADILEEKLVQLETEVAGMPADALLCPDNLDGQFISPSDFDAHLAASYARTAALGRPLVVHVGGPVGRLLPGLARAGASCIEGICGAPQGDTTLAQARSACGAEVTLWGGIAQDQLLGATPEAEFRRSVEEAFTAAGTDHRVIVGIADKVPVDALPERLAWLARAAGSR